MKKKIFIMAILLVLVGSCCTGCFKRDKMEDINIITTVYPLEYVLTKLYGQNAIINSIYPDGTDINEYKLSNKEYKDLSKKDLFVYNGISSDKDIALKLVNRNKNIMIMDSNFGMETQYGLEELWLNPSNLLMISQNIKNGLSELIDSTYIKQELNKSYDVLKVELSELDADIKLLYENANNQTLIVASPSLQFLSKYGFNVILIDDNDTNNKNQKDALQLIEDKSVKYIYILEGDKESKSLSEIKKATKIEILTIDKIDNLSDEERDNKENYVTLMKKNLEQLSKGVE